MSMIQPFEAAALSTAAPNLSIDEVNDLVRQVYGLSGTFKPLSSERDQNFCLTSTSNERYVVKISNPSESLSVVDFQLAALEHIAQVSPNQPVPRVVRNFKGHTRQLFTLPNGSQTAVRILTYLDGVQVRETPRSNAQIRMMGTGLAELNLALGDFSHPSATHDLLWNVSSAHRLEALIEGLTTDTHRHLAKRFMQRFKHHVLPQLSKMRAQVIHNDFHLYNVLVDPNNHCQLSGVIDFGDMLYAPLVGEIATAAAFHVSETSEPLAGAAQFIGAYHKTIPILPAEQHILADLIATRHLITALISQWRVSRYPDNAAYIMRHNAAAWAALTYMAGLSADSANAQLLIHIQ